MGGFTLPSRTIREMICASVDVIVQAAPTRRFAPYYRTLPKCLGSRAM